MALALENEQKYISRKRLRNSEEEDFNDLDNNININNNDNRKECLENIMKKNQIRNLNKNKLQENQNQNQNHNQNHNDLDHENSLDDFINPKDLDFTPLKYLTTFSKFTNILIRVLKKSTVKFFNSNATRKTTGQLFNLNITDKEGSEMQVTCFNKGVDKYYDMLQENKVYAICGGYIKLNDRKFLFGKNKSEYKLVIDENADIIEMPDDESIKTNHKNNFIKISEILDIGLYSIVDICVYVLDCGECMLKNTKNGSQYLRKITICDESECKAELNLWRNHAQIPIEKNQYLIIKNIKVGEFNGRNFSSYDDTEIQIDPENFKEIEKLKIFINKNIYSGSGSAPESGIGSISVNENNLFNFRNLSAMEKPVNPNQNNDPSNIGKVYFMQEILDMIENSSDNNEYNNNNMLKIKATITQMIHNDRNFYAGCLDSGCKRKSIFNEESREWICNYCSKTFEKPCYYYNLSLRVKDSSCEQWIDLFGTNAEKILKISAEDYRLALLSNNFEKLKEINDNVEFRTFYFCVKPKIQSFNGNYKKKIYAYKFENVPSIPETNRILDIMEEYVKKENNLTINKDNFYMNNNNDNNLNNLNKNNISNFDRNKNLHSNMAYMGNIANMANMIKMDNNNNFNSNRNNKISYN
jgi:hypothetical protein